MDCKFYLLHDRIQLLQSMIYAKDSNFYGFHGEIYDYKDRLYASEG